MVFVEGFLTPVPTANREAYLRHATGAVDLLKRFGVSRFVETWGDEVPDGKINDLKKAVGLADGETVLFSWFEYPDKATRDAAHEKMMADPAMAEMGKNMPFDGKRMIYGGFDAILDTGAAEKPGYVDGYVLPVPDDRKQDYLALARKMALQFREYGALRVVECWGIDVPDGKITDYNRATLKESGESVVYSWVEWPDKTTRDAGWQRMRANDSAPGEPMPFDGKRMMWGGFEPILDERQ